VSRDLRTLWDLGSIAEMPNGEILGRFVSSRENVSELAFEFVKSLRHRTNVIQSVISAAKSIQAGVTR